MDKLKAIKVKQASGQYGEAIPIGVDAANVDLINGKNLETSVTFLDEDSQETDVDFTAVELQRGDIVDNLSSADGTTKVLSANQGRVLNNKVNDNYNNLDSRVRQKIESEAVADFEEASTPEFQKKINDFEDEVSQLSESIDEIENSLQTHDVFLKLDSLYISDNRFNNKNIMPNKYIIKDGIIEDYDGWSLSDYCVVKPNTKYVFCENIDKPETNIWVANYTYDKKFIANTYSSSGSVFTTLPNAYYIRISCESSKFKPYSMILEEEIYTSKTSYEPCGIELLDTDIKKIANSLSAFEPLDLDVEYKKTYYDIDGKIDVKYTNLNFYSAKIPCLPHEKFIFSGRQYNYMKQYSIIVTDLKDNVLVKYFGSETGETPNEKISNFTFTIPENGYYLYVQSHNSEPTLQGYKISDNIGEDVKQLKDTSKNIELKNYDKICKSICRIGYKPYSSSTPPEQSIESYKLAYEKGFRILLCDLQFTSDNIPVLWHDPYLNKYGSQVYKDGVLVDKALQLYIKNMTFAELQTYDFGHYKGEQYDGLQIMTLNQMCKLCKNLGTDLYIEIKYLGNTNQAKIACDIVAKYGLKDRTSWAGSVDEIQRILEHDATARVATMPSVLDDDAFNSLLSLKRDNNKLFFFAWDTTVLTNEIVERMISNNIEFEQGNIDSEQGVLDYFAKGEPYQYCSGINTGNVIVGKLLFETEMN